MLGDYDIETGIDLFKQTARVFVPGIGVVEGVVQAITTGDPRGAARVFVPGIGVVEGAIVGSADTWELSGGSQLIQNAAISSGTLLLLTGAAALLLFTVLNK